MRYDILTLKHPFPPGRLGVERSEDLSIDLFYGDRLKTMKHDLWGSHFQLVKIQKLIRLVFVKLGMKEKGVHSRTLTRAHGRERESKRERERERKLENSFYFTTSNKMRCLRRINFGTVSALIC